jgi:hypothetical protein
MAFVGSGPMRSLEVDGKPVLDGRTGEPLSWPKAEAIGAAYGQRNDPWRVMTALLDEGKLKCVNAPR